jgi:hypothetical protein
MSEMNDQKTEKAKLFPLVAQNVSRPWLSIPRCDRVSLAGIRSNPSWQRLNCSRPSYTCVPPPPMGAAVGSRVVGWSTIVTSMPGVSKVHSLIWGIWQLLPLAADDDDASSLQVCLEAKMVHAAGRRRTFSRERELATTGSDKYSGTFKKLHVKFEF